MNYPRGETPQFDPRAIGGLPRQRTCAIVLGCRTPVQDPNRLAEPGTVGPVYGGPWSYGPSVS